MSFADGWAAVHLQMPPRVPRFEPSAAEYHWPLIRAVTGLDVGLDSPPGDQLRARQAFLRAWNYDIYFAALASYNVLERKLTRMGHAEYAEGGRDFDPRIECPFRSVQEVLAFDPWQVYGALDEHDLVRQFNEHYRRQCLLYPDCVNMTGVYVSLLSGMIAVFGWEMLLLAAGTDPRGFGEVLNRYASWIQQYYNAVARCETTVIYSHDDMVWTQGPFLHPDWYRTYVFPNLKRLWAPAREAGKKIAFICDGNYTPFVDDVAACGNSGFWFEVFTDLQYVTRRYGRTHFIIGNADCRVLTFGTRAAVRAEVQRCMAAGKGCPGYFMCVSGHIPPNVPVENALYYNEVYEELSRR